MALVGDKINKTHLCSEAFHDAKKVCILQWMLMNIDLCLIFEMKNLGYILSQCQLPLKQVSIELQKQEECILKQQECISVLM